MNKEQPSLHSINEAFGDSTRRSHSRRYQSDHEKRSKVRRFIRRGLAVAAGVGAVAGIGYESLGNYNEQQRLKNDVPGQIYKQSSEPSLTAEQKAVFDKNIQYFDVEE